MGKDPAVLFYTSDFLTGTAFFTMEQRGQYITLLCEQHQNGHIPLNHMISVCLSDDSPVINKFAKDEDGLYYNNRMDEEKEKRSSYCKSRSNNKSGRKPKKKNKSYDNHMNNHMSLHMENENENENINTIKNEFDNARKIFPGTKRGLDTEWDNFKKKNKRPSEIVPLLKPAIESEIEHKKKLDAAKQFRPSWKNFATWINQRCWEQELPHVSGNSYREMKAEKEYPEHITVRRI